MAYGYTYQDVLDEYEEAKRQYPDDLIWMEEVTTDAGKGYRIWKGENCNISGRVFSDYIFNKLNPIIWNFYLADSQNADGSWNHLSMLEICVSQWEIYRVSCFENCSTGIDSSSCQKEVVINSSNFPRVNLGPLGHVPHDKNHQNYNFELLNQQCLNLIEPYVPSIWSQYQGRGKTDLDCHSCDILLAEFIPITECEDKDGDGYYAISSNCSQGNDCNDNDPDIHPGAEEICDNKDNNCNGEKNEKLCCEDCCPTNITFGSSANYLSGNLFHTQSLQGTDITLAYNSLDDYIGSLGRGWTHNYNIDITETTSGSLLFMAEGGRRIYYRNVGSGTYRPDSTTGEHSTATKNLDDTYVLTKKDGIKYTFNINGRLTKTEDRNNNTTTFTYTGDKLTEITDSVGRKTTLSYDSNNRIVSITDYAGKTYTFIYNSSGYLGAVTDSAGYSWTYTYDSSGRMLTKSDTEGNVVTYAYDPEGRVISTTDASGKGKTISYSSPLAGEGGVRGEATITERDGGVWTYIYDSTLGVPLEMTDPQGNTTTYQYDSNRNLTKETAPDGSTTSYSYDSNGNMASVTDASGNTTNYTYNDYGQTTSIKDPQSNVIYYSYDTYGNLNSVTDLSGGITHFNYDSKGNITRITNPNGGVTVYEYDQFNNIIKITDPAGNASTFTYDAAGNMASMTDSQGNTARFEYDSLNQLIRVIDQNGNITEFSYDSKGNKTSLTDANGNTTYYEYNHNNKLTKATDALENVTTYTYGGTGGCPGMWPLI